MFRKFSNALKIAQNIPSDLTVKFSLLNVSKGKLCFSCRIYDILNGKITIFFFLRLTFVRGRASSSVKLISVW